MPQWSLLSFKFLHSSDRWNINCLIKSKTKITKTSEFDIEFRSLINEAININLDRFNQQCIEL